MMTMDGTIENGSLLISLCGSINSGNAAEAEEQINGFLREASVKEIVFDADELTYISSAGLRILLRLMKSKYKLRIINASADVYDILDTTGFTEMLQVEKAYRQVNLEGCELIGRGANGEVYRLDEETIVKVYRDTNALAEMTREREIARRAFILGIPTAIPYDIVRVDGTYGAVFEMLNATSISKILAEDPGKMDECADVFVDLLKIIHGTQAKSGDLPDMKETALDWARFLKGHIPDEQADKLYALIEAVPDDLHMLHGDYHSNNVMIQAGEALLIDMDTVCCGHPVFEFASMSNAFIGFSELNPKDSMRFLKIPRDLSISFFTKVMQRYFNTDDEETLRKYMDQAMVVGYTRLLRRTIRRSADTEEGQRGIALYKKHLAELLERVDSLLF